MPYWDRFDICEAWNVYAAECHGGAASPEYCIFGRLNRIRFKPSPLLDIHRKTSDNQNARDILATLYRRFRRGERFGMGARSKGRENMTSTEATELLRRKALVYWHRRLPSGEYQTIPAEVYGWAFRAKRKEIWLLLGANLPDRAAAVTVRWVHSRHVAEQP